MFFLHFYYILVYLDVEYQCLNMLTGRIAEITVLKEALASREAEMISIIGRRRVGKTFLVQTVYGAQLDFEISGIQNAQSNEQFRNFHQRIKEFFPTTSVFST